MARGIWLILASLVAFTASQQDKNNDENKPYKFGFNIQGYQHRKEEKDEKGIINGEYGFITADGYYRITVYATDENGSFKIISMKNIYVGFPPEDPTTTPAPEQLPGQKLNLKFGSLTPTTGKTPDSVVIKTTTLAPQTQKTPLGRGQAACAGCFLPPTTTRQPPTQQPSLGTFQVTSQRAQSAIAGQPGSTTQGGRTPGDVNQPNIAAVNKPSYSAPNTAGNQKSRDNNGPVNVLNRSNLNDKGTLNTPSGFGKDSNGPSARRQGSGPPIKNGSGGTQGSPKSSLGQYNPVDINNKLGSGEPPYGPIETTGVQNAKTTGSTVGTIGQEREGLPPGVTEDDIQDLLYRFNYTVGFHGHHEDGYVNGNKKGDYFFDGRDGVERRVEYIANEFGYQPNITLIPLEDSDVRRPKEETEKEYGLKGYEFKWFRTP